MRHPAIGLALVLLCACGGSALAAAADVRDPAAVDAVVAQTASEFGRPNDVRAVEADVAKRADVDRALREADWLRHATEELQKLAPLGLEVFSTHQPFSTTKPAMKWDGEWHITYEVFRDLGAAFASHLVEIGVVPDVLDGAREAAVPTEERRRVRDRAPAVELVLRVEREVDPDVLAPVAR